MVLTKRPHPPSILSPSKALMPFVVLLTQWNYFCGRYQIAGFITPIKDLGVSNWKVLTQPWGYHTSFPGVWDLQLCSQIKMWMAKTGNLLKHLILLKHPTLLGWEKSTCMLSNIIQNRFVLGEPPFTRSSFFTRLAVIGLDIILDLGLWCYISLPTSYITPTFYRKISLYLSWRKHRLQVIFGH